MAKIIQVTQHGDFASTKSFLRSLTKSGFKKKLALYGEMGVDALRAATPVDTGKTANSWYYEINEKKDSIAIEWKNSNVQSGVLVAVILQYGHATRDGGFVYGKDYINPAMMPVFEKISQDAWKEMKNG